MATLRVAGEFSGGARDTLEFVVRVGTAGTADPTGPDAYGYYAFDNTDVGYGEVPTYAWAEIAPNHGGPGTDVGLLDFGSDNDDSRTVDLPFPFVYYGETFSRVTICSNGWLAMGATYLSNQRNWTIPAAGAPPISLPPCGTISTRWAVIASITGTTPPSIATSSSGARCGPRKGTPSRCSR